MRRPPFGHRLREFRDPLRSQIPAVGSLMVPFGTSGSEWPLANQPGMPPVMHDAEWRLFKTIVIPAKMASSFHRVKIPCN